MFPGVGKAGGVWMLTGRKASTPLTRIATLTGLGLGGGLVVAALLVLPNLLGLLPATLKKNPVQWTAVGLLAAYALLRMIVRVVPTTSRLGDRASTILASIEAASVWLLGRGLSAILGVVCLAWLAGWIPHYLLWPWNRDTDTFATIAQSWDVGIRPYRDFVAYNFPGQTYLHWFLGKTFGWGRTMPLHAFDVASLLLLGLVLVAWSRRRLGGAVPGLIGFLAVLHLYLGLLFDQTVQRDWQTPLAAILALLTLQTWPGRRGRLASALVTALALAVRPQAVLYLPALALAVVEEAGSNEGVGHRRLRALFEWGAAFGLCVAVVFSPIVACGLVGDFLRSLRIPAYGGPYSRSTPSAMLEVFFGQFRDRQTVLVLASTLVASLVGPRGLRTLARPWVLACAGTLVYAPISPVQHDYLRLPLSLIVAVATALPAAWMLSCRVIDRPVRVLAVGLLIYAAAPGVPRFCLVGESLEAVGFLARGEAPGLPPVGSTQAFSQRFTKQSGSDWSEYVRLLDYLRQHTGPRTLVANVLNHYPFAPINGPTGRLSPFRCESGICWMIWVAIDLDPEFAAALEAADDSVVVWYPDQSYIREPRMKLARVMDVIRRRYEPEAAFGPIEVWRRKP